MKEEEYLLFQQEMQGVKPLKGAGSVFLKTGPQEAEKPGRDYRRRAAERALGPDDNFLPSGFVQPVHPQEVLSFKRNGIQNGVFHSLQMGRYPIDATLDLHLMTVEQARIEVFGFIADCLRLDVRTALINHGKGAQQREQAVIKSCIARWLPMFPEVMAFHSAQRFHGGTGAVYLLLRKTARAKEIARERMGLKSDKPEPWNDGV
jgi:DNA-nicking Smr family endonuclease